MREKSEIIHKRKKIGKEFLDEIRKKIQIIDEMTDKELGFAIRNNLIKWWEIKVWQEKNFENK